MERKKRFAELLRSLFTARNQLMEIREEIIDNLDLYNFPSNHPKNKLETDVYIQTLSEASRVIDDTYVATKIFMNKHDIKNVE